MASGARFDIEETRDRLADILWFMKGAMVYAAMHQDTPDFDERHIEALRNVREYLESIGKVQ